MWEYKPGRWRAAFTWHAPDGSSKRIWISAESEEGIARRWAERQAELAAPIVTERPAGTVRQLLERYTDEVVRVRTQVTSYRNTISRAVVISRALGDLALVDLTAAQLQRFIADMQAKEAARSTIRTYFALLDRALKQAVRWGLLERNPADEVQLPHLERKEQRTFTPAQVERLITEVIRRDDPLAAYWLLLATTGLRRGEGLGLRWQDVDLEAGTISVRGQYVADLSGQMVRAQLKTRSSLRVVHLLPRVVAALRAHRVRQDEERLASGQQWPEPLIVFPHRDGKPFHGNTVSDRWATLLRQLELPPLRLHDVRHTVATLLISAREPIPVVSALLGHGNPSITLNTYAHVLPGAQSDAVRHLERLLWPGNEDVVGVDVGRSGDSEAC